MVELDVAGEYHVAVRRFDDDAHGIRHSVGDTEEADSCASQFDNFVVLDFANVDRHRRGKFLLALLYHLCGEAPRVNRRVADAIDNVGDTADVVEVTVGYEEPAYFVATLFQICRVGQDVINARRVSFGERESAVENENIIAEFDRSHVASDFFDAAQGNNAHCVG